MYVWRLYNEPEIDINFIKTQSVFGLSIIFTVLTSIQFSSTEVIGAPRGKEYILSLVCLCFFSKMIE